MTEDVAEFLLSEPGRALTAQAESLRDERAETLPALTRLRKTATPEQAAASWEMADLRRRGQAKFGQDTARMFFVREALEQASSAGAAAYHARRFADAGLKTVADLGGGIGGDALAFARAGLRVTLVERDPVRAGFAAENARVLGLKDRVTVIHDDVARVPLDAESAWFDPARRTEGRRTVTPDDYAPPLSFVRAVQAQGVANIGVKVAPALNHAVASEYGAELEFLSDGGECKEALLWFGCLQTGNTPRAIVLRDGKVYALVGDGSAPPGPGRPEAAYLYEPDPAVIRAHLVGTLAAQIGAAPLDPQIAYLTGDELTETPFATAYTVIDRFPYRPKRLQTALDAHQVGQVVIKKRGFPQEPETVRKSLRLRGPNAMVVVLTRIGAQHWAFLCQRGGLPQ